MIYLVVILLTFISRCLKYIMITFTMRNWYRYIAHFKRLFIYNHILTANPIKLATSFLSFRKQGQMFGNLSCSLCGCEDALWKEKE